MRCPYLSHLCDGGEPTFWGHRHLQQLVCSLGRGQLGLELRDPAPGGLELGELQAPKPGPFAPSTRSWFLQL